MRLAGHNSSIIASFAFNPVERILASGDYDGKICLWNLGSRKIFETFQPPTESRYDGSLVAFSPEGSTLAVWPFNSYSKLALWNCRSRHAIGSFECVEISSIVWSPDGMLLACAEHNVTLRDGKTGRMLNELTGHIGPVLSLAWSSNGKLLATGGNEDDSSVRVWDIERSQQIGIYQPSQYAQNVESIAFYNDDALVYINDSCQPYIWYWKANTEPQPIIHGARIPHAANYPTILDRTGRYIARIDPEDYRVLHVTNIETGDKSTFSASNAHDEVVSCIKFSPDSHLIATGDYEGIIFVWNVSSPSH